MVYCPYCDSPFSHTPEGGAYDLYQCGTKRTRFKDGTPCIWTRATNCWIGERELLQRRTFRDTAATDILKTLLFHHLKTKSPDLNANLVMVHLVSTAYDYADQMLAESNNRRCQR